MSTMLYSAHYLAIRARPPQSPGPVDRKRHRPAESCKHTSALSSPAFISGSSSPACAIGDSTTQQGVLQETSMYPCPNPGPRVLARRIRASPDVIIVIVHPSLTLPPLRSGNSPPWSCENAYPKNRAICGSRCRCLSGKQLRANCRRSRSQNQSTFRSRKLFLHV